MCHLCESPSQNQESGVWQDPFHVPLMCVPVMSDDLPRSTRGGVFRCVPIMPDVITSQYQLSYLKEDSCSEMREGNIPVRGL